MSRITATLAGALTALALSTSFAAAHGCHPDVRLDRYGWHRHAPDCDRIQTHRDGEALERRRYRDYEDQPRCYERCHYVGPFKECNQVCD